METTLLLLGEWALGRLDEATVVHIAAVAAANSDGNNWLCVRLIDAIRSQGDLMLERVAYDTFRQYWSPHQIPQLVALAPPSDMLAELLAGIGAAEADAIGVRWPSFPYAHQMDVWEHFPIEFKLRLVTRATEATAAELARWLVDNIRADAVPLPRLERMAANEALVRTIADIDLVWLITLAARSDSGALAQRAAVRLRTEGLTAPQAKLLADSCSDLLRSKRAMGRTHLLRQLRLELHDGRRRPLELSTRPSAVELVGHILDPHVQMTGLASCLAAQETDYVAETINHLRDRADDGLVVAWATFMINAHGQGGKLVGTFLDELPWTDFDRLVDTDALSFDTLLGVTPATLQDLPHGCAARLFARVRDLLAGDLLEFFTLLPGWAGSFASLVETVRAVRAD